MKKFIFTFFVLGLFLVFTGCGARSAVVTSSNINGAVATLNTNASQVSNINTSSMNNAPLQNSNPNQNSNAAASGAAAAPLAQTQVVMKTSQGDISITFFDQDAPNTVKNFVKLAQSGFYDGILFHRVIPDFMIQTGDPLTKSQPQTWAVHGTGGPGYEFADEFNSHKVVRGAVAMANSGPDTNGSQFFIVTAEATPWLDGKHTVFGEVTAGMDVVDAISQAQTDANNHPLEDIKIVSITFVNP